MKQVEKFSLFAVAFLAIPLLFIGVAEASPALGTISGTVKDNNGRPLVGALVNIRNSSVTDESLKSTKTDKRGRFLAADLSPGRYVIQAKADGYKSASIETATVAASQNSVFNFTLRRAAELLDPKDEAENYRYMIRRSRHVFQWDSIEALEAAVEKKNFVAQTHGVINFIASRELSSQPMAASYAGFNFALAQLVSENIEFAVAGQSGIGAISPQRLEAQTSVSTGDNHLITLTAGYGRLPVVERLPNGGHSGLNQYSFRVADRWRVAGPIVVLYGFDYTVFDGTTQTTRIKPRLNFDLLINKNNQLFAALYSPENGEIESSEEFETARIDFYEPMEIVNLNGQVPVDRNRYEIGLIHTFDNRSRLEAAFFWEKSANRTLLNVPSETAAETEIGNGETKQLPEIERRGSARGLRIVYTRPLSNAVSTSFGYAFGQGEQLDLNSEGHPNLSVGFFHVASARLDAKIVRTGTKISTVVRFTSPHAFFAVDPFKQQLRTLDPNFSVYIAQSLPMFGFIPGRWEANIDARNLLDGGNNEDRVGLAIGQFWRSIRGGFSVRF